MITNLTTGAHELPQAPGQVGKLNEMRWAMYVAYSAPLGMAAKLIDAVDNTANNNVFRSLDGLLHYFTIYVCGHFQLVIHAERAIALDPRET